MSATEIWNALQADPIKLALGSFVLLIFFAAIVDATSEFMRRHSRIFLSLIAALFLFGLHRLGAPHYLLLLVIVAGWLCISAFGEILKCHTEIVTTRKLLSELCIRAAYSSNRVSLMAPEDRAFEQKYGVLEADPYHEVAILEKFIEVAEEQGFGAARDFLLRMDRVRLDAERERPPEFASRISKALMDERQSEYNSSKQRPETSQPASVQTAVAASHAAQGSAVERQARLDA